MNKNFEIIQRVCEFAQATGAIKSLSDAVIVKEALGHIANDLEQLEFLRKKLNKIEEQKDFSELHS